MLKLIGCVESRHSFFSLRRASTNLGPRHRTDWGDSFTLLLKVRLFDFQDKIYLFAVRLPTLHL